MQYVPVMLCLVWKDDCLIYPTCRIYQISYNSYNHFPASGLKKWAMGWDNSLIIGALEILITHHHDATVWVYLATLTFLLSHNFCALVWALDHLGIRAVADYLFSLIIFQAHLANVHNSIYISHLLVLLDGLGLS